MNHLGSAPLLPPEFPAGLGDRSAVVVAYDRHGRRWAWSFTWGVCSGEPRFVGCHRAETLSTVRDFDVTAPIFVDGAL